MMVLAVIVAVLLMNLVLSPLMNVLSVKEGARVLKARHGAGIW